MRARRTAAPRPHRLVRIRYSFAAVAIAAALLGACGDDPADDPGAATATTAARTATVADELTTSDGYRYRVTMDVGQPTAAGASPCPGTATPGRYVLPVTLTVANLAPDRPAPFPPLRIEMATAPGTRPGQVMVKDAGGACTFAPRVPSIAPGASVVFEGTTPAIEEGAAPGSAGRIEVKASESSFTLATPVP